MSSKMTFEPSMAAHVFDFDASLPQYKLISPHKSGDGEKLQKESSTLCKSSRDSRADRTVFVGNIPAICTKKQIKRLFKQYGSVQNVRLRSMKIIPGARKVPKQLVKDSSFNAYVVFSSEAAAQDSLSLNGSVLEGRHLRVDMATAKEDTLQSAQNSVFVGNLPFSVDEEKLREVFSVCGEVESVRVIRDSKSGVGKGFGFIKFNDKSGVMFALKQNRKVTVDGRILRVFRSKDEQVLHKAKQARLGGVSTFKRTSTKETKQRCLGGKVPGKQRPSDGTKNRPQLPNLSKKRRPDGTKNRYYRLPATSSEKEAGASPAQKKT